MVAFNRETGKGTNTMKKNAVIGIAAGSAIAMLAFGACAKSQEGAKDRSSKSSEASVVTNDNGIVARTFTECTVTTNGNMVTERRRETRTNMDQNGNVLETSTSEYAQSYPVGDEPIVRSISSDPDSGDGSAARPDADSFLGLKFGEVFDSTNFVAEAGEPEYLRASFTPKKALTGFDDYYVYVTPKTHRIAKVCACAKNAIDPGARWRRHYLIEALEKRYGAWARPCNYFRPIYALDIGPDRSLTVCLADSTPDYQTVIVARDDRMRVDAEEELEAIREEARKTAAEKRGLRVKAAVEAF